MEAGIMDGPKKKIHLATKLDNVTMDDIKTIGEKFRRANNGANNE
jgi:hypothetical protein